MMRNVRSSFEVLDIRRVRKYARKARSYRGAYKQIAAAAATQEERVASFDQVEKFVQLSKIHRCILNQETRYLAEPVELASKSSKI